MNILEIFQRLNLSKNAGKVYAFLLDHDNSSATHIQRELHVHRPIVYRALKELDDADILITTLNGKRKAYSVHDHAFIKNLFLDTANRISQEIENEKFVSRKKSKKNIVQKAITIFTGDDAVTAVYSDIVTQAKKGDTFYRYTSEKDLASVNALLPHNYHKKRDAKHLERLVISNASSAAQKKSRLERFIKILAPKNGTFEHNFIQLIYGDKLAFIDLSKMQAIIIENKELAAFQKVIFTQLYKKL